MAGTSEAVRVVVRVRPLIGLETRGGFTAVVKTDEARGEVVMPDGQCFTYDRVYGPGTAQAAVYETTAAPIVDGVLDGFNGTVFAYGQTGSGKTWTMEGKTGGAFAAPRLPGATPAAATPAAATVATGGGGEDASEGKRSAAADVDVGEFAGVMPRAFAHIFSEIGRRTARATEEGRDVKYVACVSYLEIYNNAIRDLLARAGVGGGTGGGRDTGGFGGGAGLKLRQAADGSMEARGLRQVPVANLQECMAALKAGARHRVVATTGKNDESSRSHAVFTVTVECSEADPTAADGARIKGGRLNLVDLAGSERIKGTGTTGLQTLEGIAINTELSALGNVIAALADMQGPAGRGGRGAVRVVPYRDSKLTLLLKDSLGGNTKTVIIANCSPADVNVSESAQTLRYASRAKAIRNKPKVNTDPASALIKSMSDEIAALKARLAAAGLDGADAAAAAAIAAGAATAAGAGAAGGGGAEGKHAERDARAEAAAVAAAEEAAAEAAAAASAERERAAAAARELGDLRAAAERERAAMAEAKEATEAEKGALRDRVHAAEAAHSQAAARVAAAERDARAQAEAAAAAAAAEAEAHAKAEAAAADREAMRARLQHLEARVLQGAHVIDQAARAEAELRHLRLRREADAEAARLAAEQHARELEEANVMIDEQYATMADEVEATAAKLRVARRRLKEATRTAAEAREAAASDRAELLGTVRDVQAAARSELASRDRALALAEMIIRHFIPPEVASRLRAAATFDDATQAWVLPRLPQAPVLTSPRRLSTGAAPAGRRGRGRGGRDCASDSSDSDSDSDSNSNGSGGEAAQGPHRHRHRHRLAHDPAITFEREAMERTTRDYDAHVLAAGAGGHGHGSDADVAESALRAALAEDADGGAELHIGATVRLPGVMGHAPPAASATSAAATGAAAASGAPPAPGGRRRHRGQGRRGEEGHSGGRSASRASRSASKDAEDDAPAAGRVDGDGGGDDGGGRRRGAGRRSRSRSGRDDADETEGRAWTKAAAHSAVVPTPRAGSAHSHSHGQVRPDSRAGRYDKAARGGGAGAGAGAGARAGAGAGGGRPASSCSVSTERTSASSVASGGSGGAGLRSTTRLGSARRA